MPDASGRPMAASAVAEIEAVIQTYFDGLYEGDADKLAAAFHPVSHLYCEKDGGVLDVPRWIFEPHYYAGVSELYVMSYLGTNFSDRIRHPLVSPVHNPHLAKMPPTYLSCGDEDAFLSHTLTMAGALALGFLMLTN